MKEIIDTIFGMCDSTMITRHHIAQTAHDLAGYMETPPESFLSSHFTNSDLGILSYLTSLSIISGLIVALTLGLIWYATKGLKKYFQGWGLKTWFVVTWICGFIVYDIGMCNGEYISLLTNAPLAIICASKIFIFDGDVSQIHSSFHLNWTFFFCFSLVHFSAAVLSTLFLIKHFGFNIIASIRMWCASSWPWRKQVSETYVFWGFNDAIYHLIKDIQKEYKKRESQDYRIVIVHNDKDIDDSPKSKTAFARIFNFLSTPTTTLDKLLDLKCLTTSAHTDISRINLDDNEKTRNIIGGTLRMKSLRKTLLYGTSKKIHMLFLSDDEKDNVHDVALMRDDTTINEFVDKASQSDDRQAMFYCHARYNSVHRVIEDQSVSDTIKVKVVDTSHINVDILKLNSNLLPVNYVTVEADATVSSDFNALVVGFSEVGKDSVRFIYEYGAFVKTGSTDNNATRSNFSLQVVDKNMSDLAGAFVANAPAIKPSMPFLNDNPNPDSLITLHEMDCRGAEFYLKLNEWIKTLNYIVIATDDDELNITLGIRVFQAAARYRKNLKDLCILVRAHNDDDGHITRIARHYNRLWAAYQAAPEVNSKRIHQNEVKKEDIIDFPIHIFGLDINTYTYSHIIADQMISRAKEYKNRYEQTLNPSASSSISAWDDFFNEIMQLKDPYKGFYPTYFGLLNLRRCQSQDIANCYHETTKSILVNEALKKCGLEDFNFSLLTRDYETTTYKWPHSVETIDHINRILTVIAQTEHLRWNASHEILGYIYDSTKDEVKLTHNNLADWHSLDEKTRSFDFNVADYLLNITITKKDN